MIDMREAMLLGTYLQSVNIGPLHIVAEYPSDVPEATLFQVGNELTVDGLFEPIHPGAELIVKRAISTYAPACKITPYGEDVLEQGYGIIGFFRDLGAGGATYEEHTRTKSEAELQSQFEEKIRKSIDALPAEEANGGDKEKAKATLDEFLANDVIAATIGQTLRAIATTG